MKWKLYYYIKGQDISNLFSSETTGPIRVRIYTYYLCLMGTKLDIIGPGHMTKMASMPIYDKKKKIKNLPQNRKSHDIESWKKANRTWTLQKLYKLWPWVDLDLFTRSNLVPNAFEWEKCKTVHLSKTVVVYEMKVGHTHMNVKGHGDSVTLAQGH